MNAVIVCVEYDDYLAISLPRAVPRFDKIAVVTTPTDKRTRELCARYAPTVICHTTRVFSLGGAQFNKGAAVEEGFDVIGRDDWMCVMDADIVLPHNLLLGDMRPGKIGGLRRKHVPDPENYRDGYPQDNMVTGDETRPGGWFQVFYARDQHLGSWPWYAINSPVADACGRIFTAKWTEDRQIWLPGFCFHLGLDTHNWTGRFTPRLDGKSLSKSAKDRRSAYALLAESRRKFMPDPKLDYQEVGLYLASARRRNLRKY